MKGTHHADWTDAGQDQNYERFLNGQDEEDYHPMLNEARLLKLASAAFFFAVIAALLAIVVNAHG